MANQVAGFLANLVAMLLTTPEYNYALSLHLRKIVVREPHIVRLRDAYLSRPGHYHQHYERFCKGYSKVRTYDPMPLAEEFNANVGITRGAGRKYDNTTYLSESRLLCPNDPRVSIYCTYVLYIQIEKSSQLTPDRTPASITGARDYRTFPPDSSDII